MAIPSIAVCTTALEQGDADHALQLAIERLRHDKDDAEALTVCYRAYAQKNDHANAIKVLEIIMQKDPQAYWAYAALGKHLQAAGKLSSAEEILRKAVEECPDDVSIHAELGVLFSELNRLEAGEWHLRRALEIGGADCDVLTNLGLNLAQQSKADAADVAYSKALDIEPRNLRALGYRAKLKEVQGDIAAAKALLERAKNVQPGSVSLLEAQLQLRIGNPEEALAILNNAQRLNGDALLERARVRDRLADYGGAWNDASEAKRRLAAEAGGLIYNATGVESFFAELKRTFDARFLKAMPRAALRPDVPQPVFITGAPRSGTTLLERILGAHACIESAGELPFVGEFREVSERMLARGSFPQNFSALHAADQRGLAAQLRDTYLHRRSERMSCAADTRFVTDKMPFNEMYLPLIRMAFPHSPVIHLSRNRLDTAVSIFFNKLNHGFHCGYRFDDIIHHLDAMVELLGYYRREFDPRLLDVEYESLVEDTEGEVRRMLGHIGLDYEPSCLRYYERREYVATPSYDEVSRRPNSTSVGRHRNYLAWIGKFAA